MEVSGWPGLAFIGRDNLAEESQLTFEGCIGRGNRWTNLPAFLGAALQNGNSLGASCAIVVDLDKTLLGPRGRNDGSIDMARSEAAMQVARDVLETTSKRDAFATVYREMNRPTYHFFTEDNQDYLVYCALMLAAGLYDFSALQEDFSAQRVLRFSDFLDAIDCQISEAVSPELRAIHCEVAHNVRAEDSTPFKSFRRQEYIITTQRMRPDSLELSLDVLLRDNITLNSEVTQAITYLRQRGALVLGLSDKPDEAVFPDVSLAAQGFCPLHWAPAWLVGEKLDMTGLQ